MAFAQLAVISSFFLLIWFRVFTEPSNGLEGYWEVVSLSRTDDEYSHFEGFLLGLYWNLYVRLRCFVVFGLQRCPYPLAVYCTGWLVSAA